MKLKEGMKAKGFKFEGRSIAFDGDMEKYVGVVGEVGHITGRGFKIKFEDDWWWYPTALAHRAFLSVGDKVKIPKTKSVGDPIEKSKNIRIAKSEGQAYLYYTGEKDGKLLLNNELQEGSGDFFTLKDVELYTKENNMRTIKKSELKKIHDVACSTWQGKITALASRNPWGDDIELSQEEVDGMFRAASASQTQVLDQVFGKQDKEIDLFSEDINHNVHGIPVFGGASLGTADALIGLPDIKSNAFYLNPNYNWEMFGNKLIVRRK
jgi:hypothetical protein